MKSVITGTFAAFVLGAAIASSQTPAPAGQAPAGAKPADEQTKPAGQAEPAGQRSTAAKPQTYRGYLRGSAASGWTISPIDARAAASSTAGATATAGGANAVTYKVVAADSSKADFASMADQCVEIVGVLAPESGAGRTSPAAGGAAGAGGGDTPAPGAGAGAQSGSMNRTLTATTIKTVEGGCKQ